MWLTSSSYLCSKCQTAGECLNSFIHVHFFFISFKYIENDGCVRGCQNACRVAPPSLAFIHGVLWRNGLEVKSLCMVSQWKRYMILFWNEKYEGISFEPVIRGSSYCVYQSVVLECFFFERLSLKEIMSPFVFGISSMAVLIWPPSFVKSWTILMTIVRAAKITFQIYYKILYSLLDYNEIKLIHSKI